MREVEALNPRESQQYWRTINNLTGQTMLCYVMLCVVFILSAISPYITGLKALFTNPTAQVQPQLTSN